MGGDSHVQGAWMLIILFRVFGTSQGVHNFLQETCWIFDLVIRQLGCSIAAEGIFTCVFSVHVHLYVESHPMCSLHKHRLIRYKMPRLVSLRGLPYVLD